MSLIVPPPPSGTDPFVVIEAASNQIIARASSAATAFVIAQQNSIAYRLLRICEVHVLAGNVIVNAPLMTFREGVGIPEKTYELPKAQ